MKYRVERGGPRPDGSPSWVVRKNAKRRARRDDVFVCWTDAYSKAGRIAEALNALDPKGELINEGDENDIVEGV